VCAKSGHEFSEKSVPWFWPVELARNIADSEFDAYKRVLSTVLETERLEGGLPPKFASPNTVVLELRTLRLRGFGDTGNRKQPPALLLAPYAGHTATIADLMPDQSLVQTLLVGGIDSLFVTDWKSATPDMRDFDIDNYLAELNVVADDLGGRVNLVGLCQGGWLAAMYAARYPEKVVSLVLAGSPIDTDAGHGPIRAAAHALPMVEYEELVAMGSGVMLGRFMLEAWKEMHPGEHYFAKYVDLYEHIEDPNYVRRAEAFASWFENPLNLPGRWYLQAVKQLFKENRLAKGDFVGLGRRLSLKAIRCPLFLLAGEDDDITPAAQVMAARELVGSPTSLIQSATVPGGHIGLFMGRKTLHDHWPSIARWVAAGGKV
jgi:poly(3-hydroxybutyrate) depolymerase